MSRLRGPGIDYERAKYFLSLYQGHSPLSRVEIEALPDIWRYVKMRVTILALEEYPAKPLDLEGFLHPLHFLNWFARNEGQLMRTLRAWSVIS